MHFAALLLFIHGITDEPFAWSERPFFLRFHSTGNERWIVFQELCQKLGVDPTECKADMAFDPNAQTPGSAGPVGVEGLLDGPAKLRHCAISTKGESMTTLRKATTIVFVALMLATGGRPAGAAEPSKASFIAAADKICTAGNTKMDALSKKVFADLAPNTPPTPAALKAFAAKAVPLLRNQVKEIRKLAQPKAEKAKIDSMLKELGKAIDTIAKDPQSIMNNEQVFATSNKQAAAYGLKVCGK